MDDLKVADDIQAQYMTIALWVSLGLLALILLGVNLIQYWRTQDNLPPGPWGLPCFGVLPLMGKKPYLTVQRWWEKYGDIYMVYMGSRRCIVVNGVEAMRECFVRQADRFNGRPWNYFRKLAKNKGVVLTDGEVWREHRKFTIHCLRDFGMGKVSLEEKIHEEVSYLLKELLKEEERPFSMHRHVPKAVANIICSIIYGSRFEYNDEVFKANINALEQSVKHQSLLSMIQFMPFLEFLPKIMPKNRLLQGNVIKREDYAKHQVESHWQNLDVNNPRDFIDAYFSRMQQRGGDDGGIFDEGNLLRTVQDLFIAGSETLTTTLKWAFFFMALYPDVQEKIQKEIDTVIGSGRWATMKDKPLMPYTEAAIMECQRLGNIALFSVPRRVTENTMVNGYNIPKGTWVFINRWGVHASTRYWPRPKSFDPTRFLDKAGNVIYPDAFIPFGMGPRNCLGENLAKMELFLFFTAVLQMFSLSFPKGIPIPSMEPQSGLNMTPQPYLLVARQR